MTRDELKQAARKSSIELGDLVHYAASHMASAANNGGVDDQVDFLIDTCGWTIENIYTYLV